MIREGVEMSFRGWTLLRAIATAWLALAVIGFVDLDVPAGRALPVTVLARQPDAGFLASIQDCRIESRYVRGENRTEVSLELVPPRPDGGPGVTLVLRASHAGQAPSAAEPPRISLRAHYGLHSDDAQRAVQAQQTTQALEIRVDPQAADGITLFFFPASWG
jgi:hypothetical protein